MSNEETWDPVARVVFKPNSGFEQRIVQGVDRERDCRVRQVQTAQRVATVVAVAAEPFSTWCEESHSEAVKKKTEEYSAKRDRDMKRRDAVLAAMSAEDRELFRR